MPRFLASSPLADTCNNCQKVSLFVSELDYQSRTNELVLCVSDLMIEMEDHTNDLSEARIPFLDYKTYTDSNFFLSSKDGANDAMITKKLQIPEARRAIVAQALNQFSNLLNSKTFLINVSLELFSFQFLLNESSFIRTKSAVFWDSLVFSSFVPWRAGPILTLALVVISPPC